MNARLPCGIAVVLGACSAQPSVLPGTVNVPLVAGSTISDCGTYLHKSNTTSCVSIPNDEHADAIVESYKHALDQRGFHFQQHFEGPNLALLVKRNAHDCDVMVFGTLNRPQTRGEGNMLVGFALRQVHECPAEPAQ